MTSPKIRILIPIVIILGILAVSTASIFIRYAQQEAPSLVIAALRLGIAAVTLAPLALARHRSELAGLGRADLLLGMASGFFLALHFATWITSLEYTSVASSVVLVTTTPLWVALASPLVLREPISRMTGLGLLLALVGGAIVGLSEGCQWSGSGLACPPFSSFLKGDSIWGNFLALAGAWMAAGYILIGRRLRAKMSLIAYIFVVYGMAAIVLLVIMISAGSSPLGFSPLTYLWILALALVPQLLGHSSFNWALGYLPASFVSVTLMGEPIGSTILAFIILQESPSLLELVGGVFILAGIFAASQSAGAK
jgi:drug/metabolite transporter (DMT)-like permease